MLSCGNCKNFSIFAAEKKNICTYKDITMPPRNHRNILVILLLTVLVITACTKVDRSSEATELSEQIQDSAINDLNKALERVDSAEESGVFTAVRGNTVKATIYQNAGRRRMAAYYAEQAIASEWHA